MVKPIKSGLTSSRSREEEVRDQREFERLFVLFEAFLQTERRPSPTTPSSSSTSSSSPSSPLPDSDEGDTHDALGQDKAKRRRRLSFLRERRSSSNKKKDKRNSTGSGSEECEAPKGACLMTGDADGTSLNNTLHQGGENAEVQAEDEEHEVRFVVGLLNGYLALKRLGDGDKNLTFSLANNKKKEEERERKELEKLRGEIVLRMTSALTDLGALPNAGSPSGAGGASAAMTGIARHQSAHDYPTSASRSPSKHARTSWRGRLRNKEKKTASLDEPFGKDKKQQQEENEERSATPAQKNEVYLFRLSFLRSSALFCCVAAVLGNTRLALANRNDSPQDWRDRLISPRTLHKRSQSLTFGPHGVMSMPLEVLVADEEEDYVDEPRIPLAELEERLRKMEELIDQKFAAKMAGSPSSPLDSKKSKRRSLNMLLRRSGAGDKADTKDSNGDDGAVDGEGSVIFAIPTSIYTKVTNRRSVYHYNIEAIREMIHQHADGAPEEDKPSKSSAESGTLDGSSVDGTSILLVGKSEGDDAMIGNSVTIVLTTPSSPPVPSLDLTELPHDEGFLSPELPNAPFHINVSAASTSELIPSSAGPSSPPTATVMTTGTETVEARNYRRTVHDKRDKMLRMRVIDSKFGPTNNVKWAFLWCEENVAPATFVKVIKAQAFARRFLARRCTPPSLCLSCTPFAPHNCEQILTPYDGIAVRKRLQIANELLVTEKHYVDILDLLVKVFLQPLRDSSLLPQESVSAIFGNTETLR
jgi:hypothetical protein